MSAERANNNVRANDTPSGLPAEEHAVMMGKIEVMERDIEGNIRAMRKMRKDSIRLLIDILMNPGTQIPPVLLAELVRTIILVRGYRKALRWQKMKVAQFREWAEGKRDGDEGVDSAEETEDTGNNTNTTTGGENAQPEQISARGLRQRPGRSANAAAEAEPESEAETEVESEAEAEASKRTRR